MLVVCASDIIVVPASKHPQQTSSWDWEAIPTLFPTHILEQYQPHFKVQGLRHPLLLVLVTENDPLSVDYFQIDLNFEACRIKPLLSSFLHGKSDMEAKAQRRAVPVGRKKLGLSYLV